MTKLIRFIQETLSIRLSFKVVSAVALLLVVALVIMFAYARQTVRASAVQKAEMTLAGTVQEIDNILLSVEQTAGNVYWDMLFHTSHPQRLETYARRIIEANPYIKACAIIMQPDSTQGKNFNVYLSRVATDSVTSSGLPLIKATSFGDKPYNEQVWYTKTVETGKPLWINPMQDAASSDSPVVSFCLPIYDRQWHVVGVMGVDVSMALISQIIHAAKPTPHSYATLLGSDSTFIVHPGYSIASHQQNYPSSTLTPSSSATTTHKIIHPKISDADVRRVVGAMMAGETGHQRLSIDDDRHYVFYKPFERVEAPGRSLEHLGWSAAIIFPENDIFGDYNRLLSYVVWLALVGLLLLQILCTVIIHRQLLPLRLLTRSAQEIADGKYDSPIPESRQHDEVGRLQNHFLRMHEALAENMGHLEQLQKELQQQGQELTAAYRQSKRAERAKTAVLHNMTNQMLAPVTAISASVDALVDKFSGEKSGVLEGLVDDIQQQGHVVTGLLDDLLKKAQDE